VPEYLELPLVDDADALVELGVDYLQASVPGLVARPGNVETVLLEANGQIGAEVVAQAALVAPVIFAYLGQNLLGIAIQEAEPARANCTVTFAADAIVTVPADSLVSVPHPDGNLYAFGFDEDVVSPSGGGDVLTTLTALEPGAAANGAYGPAELVDVLDGVELVQIAPPAAGGADEESEDDYLDRLAEAMLILAPRPILPEDHATLARQVEGVGRALAIDLLLPGSTDTSTSGEAGKAPVVRDPNEPTPIPAASKTTEPRCTTVAVTAEDGTTPPRALMDEVWALLDGNREVNFLNYVIAPTYTTVDVQATVMAHPGYLPADVLEQAESSLAEWLNPAMWGGSPGTEDVSGEWAQSTSARLFEAVDYLNRAEGVHYVVGVQLRKAGGVFAAADVPIAGLAPLPLPGAFTITVQTP
jgi:hypothetical protein